MDRVLLDSGPLVALVSQRDQYHAVCREQLRTVSPPMMTTWAVLTEAAWLLRKEPAALAALWRAGNAGIFVVPAMDESSFPWLDRFLRRYQKTRAQLADASLVFLAERENIDTVFTVDRRDFSIYRFGKNRSFNILPET